jgi:hypothetical protein
MSRWMHIVAVLGFGFVPQAGADTATPTATPSQPFGCTDVCDGRPCDYGRCPDGTFRSGSCQSTTPNGCECQPFECPGPCGITVDPVPSTSEKESITLTGNGSFAGYSQIDVFISGGAQTVFFTFIPYQPFAVDVPLNPGLNQLKFDATASGPPGCHSTFDFDVVVIGTPAPTATPTSISAASVCVGDCKGDGQVTVDEIITMVDIALGNAQPSACFKGLLSGADIEINLIIQAVNNALNRCPPTPTPPPGRCRDSNECIVQNSGFCLVPGGFPGCGPTPAPVPTWNQCQTDSDCHSRGDTFICAPVDPATCQFGLACMAGCQADSDCRIDQTCDELHRCVARPCASDADCPQLFACLEGSASSLLACQRRGCLLDADCQGGLCVTGYCYDELGTCVLPPA